MKRYEDKLKEARKYSPEFKKALADVRNTQAGAAETFGRKTAINPEVVYNWANKHGINLVLDGYKYMKNLKNFAMRVLNDEKI